MTSTVGPDLGSQPGQADDGGPSPPDEEGGPVFVSVPRHRPRRLGTVRRTIREIGFSLITGGVVVLLFVAYQLWGTGIAEARSQAKLKRDFIAQLAHPPSGAPSGGDTPTLDRPGRLLPSPPTGQAIAHLVIPRIGVDKYVVDGVVADQLRKGPGLYPQTSFPGQPGNSAIAGHRTTYGAPFYRLNELKKGDDIDVTTAQGRFLYVVSQSMIVPPNDVAVLAPTTDNRLTLTTCNPRFEATNRLVVVAELTGLPVLGTVAAGAHLVSGALNLGVGDRSAWPPALIYGLMVLALWLGVRLWNARARSWRWIPFLIGIPICLVPLWFAFENVIRLLPTNI